jgi:hypothetical protein
MPYITLTAEQTKVLATALDPVEIRDVNGRVVAVVSPIWTRDDIARARQVLADPSRKWYTFDEVMARLRSLETA